jgi:ACS family hexuronate transporter-like MFS transporter
MGLVMLAASLSYLDRQLLAAFAPTIKLQFHLSNAQYGQVVGAFALTTAIAVPLMGLLLDHAGLKLGASLAVAVWSLFGVTTGFVRSLGSLVAARIGLAFGESAMTPSLGKAGALFLDQAELAVSGGFGAVAITLGTSSAPLLAAALGPIIGWRGVFIATGTCGFLWVLIFRFAAKRIPPRKEALVTRRVPYKTLLRDPRLWGMSAAWALVLSNFAVWSSWMTIFLVQQYHLSEGIANRKFAWLPPVFSIGGAFVGGLWVYRQIRRGKDPLESRLRNCFWMGALLPASILAPWMPSPNLAVLMVGMSYLGVFAISANTLIMPLDVYGAPHAGLANSLAGGCYALLQTVLGPLVGVTVDHFGFRVALTAAALLSLSSILILKLCVSRPIGRTFSSEVLR